MEWRVWSVLIVDVAGMWLRHPRKLVPHFTDAGSMQCRSTVTANGSGLPGYHHGHITASQHTDQTALPLAHLPANTHQQHHNTHRDHHGTRKQRPRTQRTHLNEHLKQQPTGREREREKATATETERAIVRYSSRNNKSNDKGTGRDGGK